MFNSKPNPTLSVARIKRIGIENPEHFCFIGYKIMHDDKIMHKIINRMMKDADNIERKIQMDVEQSFGSYTFINKKRLQKLEDKIQKNSKKFKNDVVTMIDFIKRNFEENEFLDIIHLIEIDSENEYNGQSINFRGY